MGGTHAHWVGPRGAATALPPLTWPGSPGHCSGRRRQSGRRGLGGCPHGPWAAWPGCSRSGSDTTRAQPSRLTSRHGRSSRRQCCYTGWGCQLSTDPSPALPTPAQRPAGDTHQSETHSVLPTRAGQILQADAAVQLEGGLWVRALCQGGIPTPTKVELIEGIDILLGELVQGQQMVARQSGPEREGRAGSESAPRPPRPVTGQHPLPPLGCPEGGPELGAWAAE